MTYNHGDYLDALRTENAALRASFERDRDDIVSGNVWPEPEDPRYVEWLERRVRDLESQLALAEELLAAGDRRDRHTLNLVAAQLEAEEHRRPDHPSKWGKR